MNTKNPKKPTNTKNPLGKSLGRLMATSAATQLDRRAVSIKRLQERVEELEVLVATLDTAELRKAEAKRDYVLGRISYREFLARSESNATQVA